MPNASAPRKRPNSTFSPFEARYTTKLFSVIVPPNRIIERMPALRRGISGIHAAMNQSPQAIASYRRGYSDRTTTIRAITSIEAKAVKIRWRMKLAPSQGCLTTILAIARW